MRRIRVVAVLGLLVLVAIPGTEQRPDASQASPSKRAPRAASWAQEAIEWIEARNEAARLGIPNLLQYVAPDIVFDGSGDPPVVGRAEYAALMQRRFGPTAEEATIDDPYLDVAGVVVDWAAGGPLALEVAGGLTTLERDADPAWGYGAGRPEAIAANAVVGAYLQAWSQADPSAVGALYAEDAEVRDSLLRLRLRGRDAIEAHAEHLRSTGTVAALRTDESPGSFRTDVYVRFDGEPEVIARFIGSEGHGWCPGRVAVSLLLSDGLIAKERRYHEVGSVRRCWDTDDLPVGWWTGLRPVPPYADEVTGTVDAAGARIEIRNGDPSLGRLVRWSLGRFEAAGLAPPSVESVTFSEGLSPMQCAGGRDGLTIDLGDTAQVFVCLGRDDACADVGCGSFVESARLVMLHELAHAWMGRQVDEATRREFVERFGLEAWFDADLDWRARGVEQAAQVIAWGLMDEVIAPILLGDPPCDELAAGFLLLTGAEPLRGPCAAS